jgi:hypothetical protein
MTILSKTRTKIHFYLLNIAAFITVTAIPSLAGPLTDATTKSKTFSDKLTTNGATGTFDFNESLWGVIGFMLIVGIAIQVGFSTMDGMGSQKTWRDHLWDVLGSSAPIIFAVLFMGVLVNWVAG